jgi:penicillin-insensitive murein endopeptidase
MRFSALPESLFERDLLMFSMRRLVVLLVTLLAFGVTSGLIDSTVEAQQKKTTKKPAAKSSAKKKPTKKKPSKKKKKRSKKKKYNFAIPVPKDPGTQSVGVASHGRLYNPSQVPLQGQTFRVRKSNQTRGTNYGNQSLIDVLQYAADKVAAKDPTAVLYIGDMSDKDGGQLYSHKSHQSGLDADLSIYMRDAKGVLKPDGEFFKLNAAVKTYDGKYTLDADLCWTFVEALLTSPHAQIQYLFIANPIKNAILEAGKRANADPQIIERASFVMQQPRDSSPHADHFHIRIYCPSKDLADGCMPSSIIWPWVEGIKSTGLAHSASLNGKGALPWAIDGGDLSDCYEGEKDDHSKPGEPQDGDYVCVDPEAYEEFIVPDEDVETDEGEGSPEEGGEGD